MKLPAGNRDSDAEDLAVSAIQQILDFSSRLAASVRNDPQHNRILAKILDSGIPFERRANLLLADDTPSGLDLSDFPERYQPISEGIRLVYNSGASLTGHLLSRSTPALRRTFGHGRAVGVRVQSSANVRELSLSIAESATLIAPFDHADVMVVLGAERASAVEVEISKQASPEHAGQSLGRFAVEVGPDPRPSYGRIALAPHKTILERGGICNLSLHFPLNSPFEITLFDLRVFFG